jgi:3-deoxy-7-phosphoheptulonate synthase
MERHGVTPNIIVDCSHGNSNKDHTRQPTVFNEVLQQIQRGDSPIVGWMLESNLHDGRQDLGAHPLKYGVSITDACISWESTEPLLRAAHEELQGS